MFDDFNLQDAFSHLEDSVTEMYSLHDNYQNAKAEYEFSKDECLFETRNLLRQMQAESKKDSEIQTKRFIVQTVLSVAALIAAVVAAVAAVIPLI